MKKILTSIFFCLGIFFASAQSEIKMTISLPFPGAVNQVDVYITPNFTENTRYFTNIIIPIALPITTSPFPATSTWAMDPGIGTGMFESGSVLTGYTDATYAPDYRIYRVNLLNSNTTPTILAAGVPIKLGTLTFPPVGPPSQVYLLDLSGGGSDFFTSAYINMNIPSGTVGPAGQVTAQPANPLNTTAGTTAAPAPSAGSYAVGTTQTIPLPVNFISFDARKMGSAVKLDWKVSAEENIKGYYVERSIDGLNWEPIGFVGPHLPAGTNDYTLTDNSPVNGKNYYRIREEDIDGKSYYSVTRLIIIGESQFTLVLHPVPAKDVLNVSIQTEQSEKVVMRISDATGRVVITRNLQLRAGSNTEQVSVSNIARGVYFLQVSDGKGRRLINKFVKE